MESKNNKQKYVKKDPISHIIDRPDMYVGSTRSRKVEEYVVVDENFHIERREIDVSPAILRIFIEPLSNIVDNVARSIKNKNNVSKIYINIDETTGETTFQNDGDVISVEMHPEEKCYNHTMIFGQLLTSSNYDDDEDRENISGRNGLGIKVANVFSKKFYVEGADPDNKKLLKQTWENNMRKVSEPIITALKTKKGYTKIVFTPDFSQFGLTGYTSDILSLYKRFVVDTAMLTKVPTFYNDVEIPVKNLPDYSKLYSTKEVESLHIKCTESEVVIMSDENNGNISFANGIYTPLGGTHVDAWNEAIFRPLLEKINKPKKPQLNISDIKKFFKLFIVATVKKPEFDSQSKTKLESPQVKVEVKKSHISTISSWSIMERLEDMIRAKEMVVLKKSERKKRGHERIEGLDPANNEGGTKGRDCTLILVEGLSAKTYAVWGIQKGVYGKSGRDWYGIYALRGKVLNTRNATPTSVSKNNVVTDIIKSLGLRYDDDYTKDENFEKLRYGKVMVITDADVDGLHICGLIQNFFHSLFPSLLKRQEPFLVGMQTPIVRVYLGKNDKLFYDEREYKKYVLLNADKKINKKYYKGLGASNEKDVIETFGEKIIEFYEDEKTFDTMNKVFHKKYSEQRKDWLEKYNQDNIVLKWTDNIHEKIKISFSEYINTELIKFSLDDCKRSIPSLIDGMKESHRKVLFVCFKRALKYSGKTLKVAQLAGSVAEKSGYHHGEQNLYKTITGMANDFVGSNNIPLLYRDGQFGSRIVGGDDAANARYIYTKLDYLTRLIYREEDDVLLEYLEDDGESVEPKFYVPIIPMILVNGCTCGIGTGWSSYIPCYNPLEIIDSVKIWLEHDGNVIIEEQDNILSLLPEIKPWYRGYTGNIEKIEENKYISWGKIETDTKNNIIVNELPIGMWTDDFKDMLEQFKQDKYITNYKNYSTPKNVNFTIKESEDGIKCDEKNLKLFKYIRTSNMVLFTEQCTLKKFNSTDQIIDQFCKVRYDFYTKRKMFILNSLEHNIKFLGNKKRFLQEVRDGEIKLFEIKNGKRESRKNEDIINELQTRGYDRDKSLTEDDIEEKSGTGYEYLLRLQIGSITAEKINKLQNDIDSNIKERDELQLKTEKHLWLEDLEKFEIEYKKWLVEIQKEVKNKKIKK